MEQYDYDLSGTLTSDEFLDFATHWFENNGGAFLQRVLITSFIGMVVLPESANLLHSQLPFKRFVPRIMFKVLFGVGTFLSLVIGTNLLGHHHKWCYI